MGGNRRANVAVNRDSPGTSSSHLGVCAGDSTASSETVFSDSVDEIGDVSREY